MHTEVGKDGLDKAQAAAMAHAIARVVYRKLKSNSWYAVSAGGVSRV